jgi:hypothetical protein
MCSPPPACLQAQLTMVSLASQVLPFLCPHPHLSIPGLL